MVERESDTGATERSTEPGQGPQTLAQLQATGAEVVGSCENKIVLDLPTAEPKELGEKESLGEGAPGSGSMSENPG